MSIVKLKLSNNLIIEVIGEYYPPELSVGLPASFIIRSIEIVKGKIEDLLEWCDKIASAYDGKVSAFAELEELALESLKNS